MKNSPAPQPGPKLHFGKALLALLYVYLFALFLAAIAGMLSVNPPAAIDAQEITLWIFVGFIYITSTTLLPFLAGITAHVVIGGRLTRPWLGLLLAVTCASVGLLQAFGLMELVGGQPMARMLTFVFAALVSPIVALWATLYALLLRPPKPTDT